MSKENLILTLSVINLPGPQSSSIGYNSFAQALPFKEISLFMPVIFELNKLCQKYAFTSIFMPSCCGFFSSIYNIPWIIGQYSKWKPFIAQYKLGEISTAEF